jgi:hypothetical protein
MRQFIEDERNSRRIERDDDVEFRNWGEERGQSGTSSIIPKTEQACKHLEISLKKNAEENEIHIKRDE